jgi:methylglutaconyl-CoA hydratase
VHEVVVDEAGLDIRVGQIVDEILSAGPTAARTAKATIRDLRAAPAEVARRMTVERIARQRTSPEGQEGLSAFLEKRPPSWRS